MPLTQIGRMCTAGSDRHSVCVDPGRRFGLCWVSANHDQSLFENPHKVVFDRSATLHVSFGFRDRLCQTPLTRDWLFARYLFDAKSNIEARENYDRAIGFDTL